MTQNQTPQDIIKKYNGFSDFMRNATEEDKRIVFEDVAQRTNEEQREVVDTPFVNVGTFLNHEIYMEEAEYKEMKEKMCEGKTRTHYPDTPQECDCFEHPETQEQDGHGRYCPHHTPTETPSVNTTDALIEGTKGQHIPQKGNCPFCDETGWGGSDEMFESYRKDHEAGHPHTPQPRTVEWVLTNLEWLASPDAEVLNPEQRVTAFCREVDSLKRSLAQEHQAHEARVEELKNYLRSIKGEANRDGCMYCDEIRRRCNLALKSDHA